MTYNLKHLFRYGSNPVLTDGNSNIFVDDIQKLFAKDLTNRLSRSLVFTIIDNDLDGISGYLSLILANAVPFMLSPSTSREQIDALVHSYQPNFIWVKKSINFDFDGMEILFDHGEYELIQVFESKLQLHSDLALMLGTSGSTGSAKYVRLSYSNVIANAESIAKYLELSDSEVPITTLPPTYSYGLSVIHSHLTVGATIAVTNKTFFDRDFWNFFRKVNVTSFAGVPYHFEMLKKLRMHKMQLPSLKTITQAGGRMDKSLALEYASFSLETGRRFFIMYGQTEATARITYLPPSDAVSKSDSIGVPVPGSEIILEDQNENPIVGDQIEGELVLKGPGVCMGYAYSNFDLSKGDEFGGVLKTGDLAKRDVDGYYYIVGRLNRFVKLYGYRINLHDVEDYLNKIGYEAACIGDDAGLSIFIATLDKIDTENIKKTLVNYLQVSPQSVSVHLINTLPRSEAGKVSYADLEKRSK